MQKDRLNRLIYTIITLFAVIMALWGVCHTFILHPPGNDECAWRGVRGKEHGLLIDQIVPGGVADQAGLKNGDILITFNGMEFSSSSQAAAMLNAIPGGTSVPYKVLRNGKEMVFYVKIRKLVNITSLAMAVLGFGFIVVGYTAVLSKPNGFIQRRFWLYSLSSMVVFTMPNIRPPAEAFPDIARFAKSYGFSATMHNYGYDILNWFYLGAGMVYCLPMLIIFFFDFPSKTITKRTRILIAGVLFTFSSWRALASAGVFGWSLPVLVSINFLNPFFYFTAGLVVFFVSYFIETSGEKRRQLRPIFVSVILGFSLMTYLFIVSIVKPFAIFLAPYLLLPALLIITVPFAFGYSIFRYGLMDFDIVLRRSLVYGGVTSAIAVCYLAFIFGFGSVAESVFGVAENTYVSIFALVVVALALDPVKRKAQDAIDRIFFREQLNYRRILTDFTKELHVLSTVTELVSATTHRIRSAMHTEQVTVSFYGHESLPTTSELPEDSLELPHSARRLLAKYKRTLYVTQAEGELREISPSDRAAVLNNGVELLVPFIVQDTVIGSLNVGRKMNGKPFSGDDIELLSTVAVQAATAIENARLHEAEKEAIKLQEELSVARNIQQGLLPKTDPKLNGFDISGVSIPAQVVGGDYFDYIRLNDHQLLVLIADVSGKGMPAALYMAKFQGMMQIAARLHASPKVTLVYLNDLLIEVSERRMFISAAAALINTTDLTITLCRAGHPAPALIKGAQSDVLLPSGLALGLAKGAKFAESLEETTIQLESGNFLMLYTDGVTETRNREGHDFGDALMISTLCATKNSNATSIKTAMLESLDRFRGDAEQHDDTTLVVIRAN